jgi:hypothetical protein
MSITIIVKDSQPKGRTRTGVDQQLQGSWGSTSFQSEEDRDKCSFVERKLKKHFGADDSRVTAAVINRVAPGV